MSFGTIFLLAWLALSIYASILITKQKKWGPERKIISFIFVWVAGIIGAVILIAIAGKVSFGDSEGFDDDDDDDYDDYDYDYDYDDGGDSDD